MFKLLKNCIPASRLSSRGISKRFPFDPFFSKTFVTGSKTPFWSTNRYSFSKKNIHSNDERNQNNYAQQFLISFESLNIAVSKLQTLLKSLRERQDQLDTAFLESSQQKAKQQVVEIVELVRTLKSQTIQLEKIMFEGVQLIHKKKINKGLLSLFNRMQKKWQQRTNLADRMLVLGSKISKDKVDPKLMKILQYLGGIKQQAQIRGFLMTAFISTLAINNMDTITKTKDSKYFLYNAILPFCIAIITLLIGHYFSSQEFKEKTLAKQHRNVVQMKKGAYLEGSKIQDEIKEIIDILVDDRFKMIIGCPGVGKSTALRKILSERKKNSEFFFFTFQSIQSQEDCDKASRNLLSLLYGIKKMHKGSTIKDKKIKIIIDDINKIERLKDQGLAERILTLIYTFSQSQSLDLICVSSSSTFVEALQFDSQHKKSVKTFIIQSQHSEEFINNIFVTKLQQKYLRSFKKRLDRSETFWKKFRMISKEVFDYGFTPRFIEGVLCDTICDQIKIMESSQTSQKLVDQQEQNQIEEITKIVQEKKSNQDFKINQQIRDYNPSNLKNYKEVLRRMNQLKKFDLDDCFRIRHNIPLSRNMVEYLNKQNLIMFCRPRTRKERAAFQYYIKTFEQSTKQSEKPKKGKQK